jgi:hypothetical protein
MGLRPAGQKQGRGKQVSIAGGNGDLVDKNLVQRSLAHRSISHLAFATTHQMRIQLLSQGLVLEYGIPTGGRRIACV